MIQQVVVIEDRLTGGCVAIDVQMGDPLRGYWRGIDGRTSCREPYRRRLAYTNLPERVKQFGYWIVGPSDQPIRETLSEQREDAISAIVKRERCAWYLLEGKGYACEFVDVTVFPRDLI